jgi:hypothetical protein
MGQTYLRHTYALVDSAGVCGEPTELVTPELKGDSSRNIVEIRVSDVEDCGFDSFFQFSFGRFCYTLGLQNT